MRVDTPEFVVHRAPGRRVLFQIYTGGLECIRFPSAGGFRRFHALGRRRDAEPREG